MDLLYGKGLFNITGKWKHPRCSIWKGYLSILFRLQNVLKGPSLRYSAPGFLYFLALSPTPLKILGDGVKNHDFFEVVGRVSISLINTGMVWVKIPVTNFSCLWPFNYRLQNQKISENKRVLHAVLQCPLIICWKGSKIAIVAVCKMYSVTLWIKLHVESKNCMQPRST